MYEGDVAVLTVVGSCLTIAFGDEGREVTLDMKSKNQAEVSRAVLADPNFWVNFLDSFSKAINNHVEST